MNDSTAPRIQKHPNELDVPIRVEELYQPNIIMVRWWPRTWVFRDAHASTRRTS